jgi:biopolymer transport protein ExbB/TolQ
MNALLHLFHLGGPVLVVIALLGVVLFERCLNAFLYFYLAQRRLGGLSSRSASLPLLRYLQRDLEESFQRKRLVIATMITAAPLLGLLGTVSGMISTFHSMSLTEHQRSVEGLASGISEALTATQAGLIVAVPGVLALYFAHREAQKGIQHLATLERQQLAEG